MSTKVFTVECQLIPLIDTQLTSELILCQQSINILVNSHWTVDKVVQTHHRVLIKT